MSKPASAATFQRSDPTYEEDGYGWAMHQAALIRAGQTEALDLENIAEEIESVGKSQRKSLQSNLLQIVLHMMKRDAQPERQGRSWFVSINNHREAALDDLAENPSLKPQLDDLVRAAIVRARRRAADETGVPARVFAAIEYSPATVFDREHILPDDC